MASSSQSCMIIFILMVLQAKLQVFGCIYEKQPNIIIILADELGWNDVSFHGSDQIPTPNIDALAYNGVILNNHYVQPSGTSTRAALMTGKYPIHTGMQGFPINPLEKRGLPLTETTMAQQLKKLGYSTNIIGKWHLGYYKLDYFPTRRGFDYHFGFLNRLISYYDHILEADGNNGTYYGYDFRRNEKVSRKYEGKYATSSFTEEAIKVIKNHKKNKPLFLYLAHLAVHGGNEGKVLEAPEETIDKFANIFNPNRRTYAAMVTELDKSVGKVLKTLEENHMLSNSIVVFLSDNGSPITVGYVNWGNNQPFRGEKYSMFEGGVKTAAVVWSPLIKDSSRVSEELIHVTDWLPTLYSAAGGNVSDLGGELDGINMWPSITENIESPRKQLLVNIDETINYGSLVLKKDSDDENGKSGTYKIIVGQTPDYTLSDFQPLDDLYLPKAYDIRKVLSSTGNKALKKVTNKTVDAALVISLRTKATIVCQQKSVLSSCNDICLFDLINDPCEQINLSTDNTYTSLIVYLQGLYNAQNKTLVPGPPQIFDDGPANPKNFNFVWSPWIGSCETVEILHPDIDTDTDTDNDDEESNADGNEIDSDSDDNE
ncbi:arylsulfatase B-like [Lycorma delicatula]|uniref:arylsulfatase B-like n=1 Tax=Lycorma delicatula TaxID=130591 RepID=UPI003F50F6D8